MRRRICYFLGTYEDWGGASRALLNFIVRVDRQKFDPLVVVTKPGKLLDKLAELGIATAVRPKQDWNGNPFKFVLDVFQAIAFLREQKVDLIHLNGGSLGWKPPELIAARILGTPVLMHYHIVSNSVTPFLRFVQGVIAVSRFVAEHTPFGGKSISVVHNIADVARFGHGRSIRQELGFAESDIVIGFLGQIKSIKGVEMFLRLPAALDNPKVKFMIAGETKDKDPEFIARFNAAVAANPAINYVGFRSDPENIYASADILVMPSQWEEPCAMVLFESAAARKPIIASRTGGTPEIIQDGVNGLLFERDDFAALVRHIRQLIDHPAERAALGERAYQAVEKSFIQAPVQKLEHLYLETLG